MAGLAQGESSCYSCSSGPADCWRVGMQGRDARSSVASGEAGHPDFRRHLLIFKCWQLIQKLTKQIVQAKQNTFAGWISIWGDQCKTLERTESAQVWELGPQHLFQQPNGGVKGGANSPTDHCGAGIWLSVFGFLFLCYEFATNPGNWHKDK